MLIYEGSIYAHVYKYLTSVYFKAKQWVNRYAVMGYIEYEL